MAITIDANTPPVPPAPAKPVAPVTPTPEAVKPAPQPQPTRNNPQQGNIKMNNMITSRQNYGISRTASSQSMRAILETIDKIAEADGGQLPNKLSYITLDGDKEGMKISAVVVVATPREINATNKFAAYHTLLLDATSKADRRREMTTAKGGMRFERVIISGEAYDTKLSTRVAQAVGQQFPGYTLIDADSSVVPSAVDLKSELVVRNIVANATNAAGTLLAGQTNNDAWILTSEVVKNYSFKNEVKSSYGHFADLAGNPIRADVVMEMSLAAKQGNDGINNTNNSNDFVYNNDQTRDLITQMTGYIDIASVPQDALPPAVTFGMNNGVNPNMFKINAARMIITNIDTPGVSGELPVIMQALGTLQLLQNKGMWKNVLLKQYKDGAANMTGGVNIRDLSAISLEAPVVAAPGFQAEPQKPVRLPLMNNAINDTVALSGINTYFIDQMLFSLDVEESGPSSWMIGVFAAAARGDVNARRDIFEAGDMVTNNKFSEIYKTLNNGAMPTPVYNDDMYVDLGYYQSVQGQRDIRDVDRLAVLNATGDSELETVNDWGNLQVNTELDALFRLSETRKIQQSIIPDMVVTGRAIRVTLNPTLVHAMALAVEATGLNYDTDMSIAAPQSTARMTAPYMRNLPNLGDVGGFMSGSGNRTGAAGQQANSFGRYALQQQPQQNRGGSNF